MSTATLHRNKPASSTRPGAAPVPWLLNGDHLTVPEFERRYEATPNVKKAELIEGIVIMSPPVSSAHSESNLSIGHYLKEYAQATPGLMCGVNASVRLDGRNEFQPDALLRIESGRLARSKVAADGLVEGGPELVVEIALSSAGYDLHEKKAAYQRALVPEYIVWRPLDAQIQWFALDKGEYAEPKPQPDGTVRSRVFPGLWLNLRALVSGDDRQVSRSLEKGLKNAEHAAFVKRLRETK